MALRTAPPRIISLKEYEQDWKPDGWELLVIGPTSTWRETWGEWEAIRDIVQNALDETEAYTSGYDDNGFWIADKGAGVAIDDFLLGPPKHKPDYARGKFGEGMKIAALALVRMGHSVHIKTVRRELWVVFLEQKTNGKAESLAALWRPNGTRIGTKFHIQGYSGPDFRDRFTVNLPREAILAQGPSPLYQPEPRYNQLINVVYTGNPRIYARDIYMQDIKSLFSYNLWGFAMSPDRHGPASESAMWADVGRLWCCVTQPEHISIFLQMIHVPPVIETSESFHINMSLWDMGREPKSGKEYTEFIRKSAYTWKKAWHVEFGADAVIRTSDRWDNMVKHLGYTPHSVHVMVKDALGVAIPTDKDLIEASTEKLRETQVVPDAKLTPAQRAHLSLARVIINSIQPRLTGRTVKAIHASIIPPASDRVRTAGMYNTTTTEIFIDLRTLEKGVSTVDAVIHELAHHTSQAEDLTEKHSSHISMVAGYVVEATNAGRFDDFTKNVTW